MKTRLWILAPLALTLTACPRENDDEALTAAEARQALEETQLASQAETLASGTVEIATNFTIGQLVEDAAQEIRTFIESQLPCAEVTVSAGSLEVEYGAREGECTYAGQTYSGVHRIDVERNDDGDVLVHHVWDELCNQQVCVSGNADVTWSSREASRRVVHQLTWTRLSDGRTGTGSGDRMQTALAGGVLEGIEVNGSRSWEGQRGTWDLAIDGVQMRWIDPVPQAGSYTLATPADKSLTMAFERQDEDTIRVTVTSGDRGFHFDVTALGISQSD